MPTYTNDPVVITGTTAGVGNWLVITADNPASANWLLPQQLIRGLVPSFYMLGTVTDVTDINYGGSIYGFDDMDGTGVPDWDCATFGIAWSAVDGVKFAAFVGPMEAAGLNLNIKAQALFDLGEAETADKNWLYVTYRGLPDSPAPAQMARLYLPPVPAPSPPVSGFVLYTDAADNHLKAMPSTGPVVTLA